MYKHFSSNYKMSCFSHYCQIRAKTPVKWPLNTRKDIYSFKKSQPITYQFSPARNMLSTPMLLTIYSVWSSTTSCIQTLMRVFLLGIEQVLYGWVNFDNKMAKYYDLFLPAKELGECVPVVLCHVVLDVLRVSVQLHVHHRS